MPNYAEALMTARRKSRLAGKPLTTQEVAGVTEGFAEEASTVAGMNLQAKELSENRRVQKEQAKRTEKLEKKQSRAAGVGALAGAGLGLIIPGASPITTALGASIGSGVGEALGGECIIVTACTSDDSPEVNLTREYRDKFLTKEQIIGYYWLASLLVPLILKLGFFKSIVKRFLVDRLIDHGSVALGKRKDHKYRSSYFISEKFLSLCSFLGFLKGELSEGV